MNGDAFRSEVDRARGAYDEYDTEGRYRTAWAAFDEVEAAYRSQQALAMGTLMRETGLRDLAGLKVLDVGCGRGRHLRAFVDMGARPEDLTGVDIHEPSIAYARSRAPHLCFRLFSGSEIPYPDASFDLVTQFVVFSSIALPDLRQQLAAEMWRVLRPGGYIFWWDTLQTAERVGSAGTPVDLSLLFGGLARKELRVRRKPSLGESVRMPRQVRRFVRPVLDRMPVVNYPTTHVAALIGPKT